MRKLISTAVLAGLVAGLVAATAAAQTTAKFSVVTLTKSSHPSGHTIIVRSNLVEPGERTEVIGHSFARFTPRAHDRVRARIVFSFADGSLTVNGVFGPMDNQLSIAGRNGPLERGQRKGQNPRRRRGRGALHVHRRPERLSMVVGEQIESPSMGLRVTWRDVGEDVLAFDLVMRAGASVIPLHVHPRQEERITVLSGTLRSRSGGREQLLGVGDVVVTPPGEAHTIEPADGEDAEVRAEVRPPLRYGEFMERSCALDRAGHINTKGRANPVRMATTGPADAEFFLSGPPIAVQKLLLRFFAAIGRAGQISGR